MNVVTKAIEQHGLRPLAAKFGISYQAIQKWESSKVPAERVPQFQQITGFARHLIRPDLYEDQTAA